MAHPNEREYLRRYLAEPDAIGVGPGQINRVLEVGGKQYGHGIEYGTLFPGAQMIGVDQEAGSGVQLVADLTEDVPRWLTEQSFHAILCCSVLEHCAAPWKMAAVLERLLERGGLLYVTVPWIWRFHPYPKDYFRMSADGVRQLFPAITWERVAYATQQKGEFFNEGTNFDGAPWRQIQGQRVALISQMICMIGRKT